MQIKPYILFIITLIFSSCENSDTNVLVTDGEVSVDEISKMDSSIIPLNYETITLHSYHTEGSNYDEISVTITPSNNCALLNLSYQQSIYSANERSIVAVDTTFEVDSDKYQVVFNAFSKIKLNDFIFALNARGTDGSSFTLEYGNRMNKLVLEAWTPHSSTKQRKLESYLRTCKEIYHVAGLDTVSVFE